MNIIVLLRKQRERERRETSFDDIPVMFTSANFIRPQIFYFFQQIVLQFFCDIHIFPREIGHIVQVGTALCVFFSSLVAFFFWSAKPSTLFYIYFGVWYLEISSTSRCVLQRHSFWLDPIPFEINQRT